jgi:hypothetical protein
LFFWNVEPDGIIDGRTLHAGLPTRGEVDAPAMDLRPQVMKRIYVIEKSP